DGTRHTPVDGLQIDEAGTHDPTHDAYVAAALAGDHHRFPTDDVAGGVSCPGADDNVAPVVARLQSRSGDAEANGLGRQCDGRRYAENGPRRYHPEAAQEATVVPDLPGDVEIVLSQLPAFPGQEPGEADIEMRRVA